MCGNLRIRALNVTKVISKTSSLWIKTDVMTSSTRALLVTFQSTIQAGIIWYFCDFLALYKKDNTNIFWINQKKLKLHKLTIQLQEYKKTGKQMQALDEKHAFYATNLYSCHFFTVLLTYIICSFTSEEIQAKNVSEMHLIVNSLHFHFHSLYVVSFSFKAARYVILVLFWGVCFSLCGICV